MDRITIKPTSKEIVLRSKPEDGHVDVFSYNYEGSSGNGLGSLFIVGQVQPATDDTSYMVNLVASLAKREYYAHTELAPKEAFSKTLKKINEILQDFFKNKEAKINIGIFSVVGDNIFVSRLGKFKILLGRGGENIDILNNITLFNKDHIQEKEFSNILSGKVIPKDKIFAYYPAKTIISREKKIKEYLLKLAPSNFIDELNSIKSSSANFLCAGIHISIDKHTEPAIIKRPQPREMRDKEQEVEKSRAIPQTVLTKAGKDSENIITAENPKTTTGVDLPQAPLHDKALAQSEPYIINTAYSDKKEIPTEKKSRPPEHQKETPALMRPTEFSSAKRNNFIDIILKKYKPSGIYIIGHQELLSRKLIWASSLVVLLVITAIVLKMTLIPSFPIPGMQGRGNKAVNALIEQTQAKIKIAQEYKDQNNLLEARRALTSTLFSIKTASLENEKLLKARAEIVALLDQIDNAIESSPNLLYQLSQEVGKGTLLSYTKDKILVYTSGLNESAPGNLLQTTETGIEKTVPVSNFNPLYLIGGNGIAIMLSKLSDQIGSLAFTGGDVKTSTLALSGSVINVYPYQDNLYILASDGIYKIIDVGSGKNSAINWLSKDVQLPPEPSVIAVDGNVFIMTKGGFLDTYYKGEKKSEVNTNIPVNTDSVLLTTTESPNLYLVDKQLGRIYILSKSSGILDKTIKLNNDQPLISASISSSGTIYLLTGDNKVWKVVP